MANTGNTQQQINYGAAANDGQGDPLRTAFIKTDDNFDAIWNAGPVGSNITIVNNTLQSNNTNGNIVLRPNGVGVIQANAAIIPNATNLRDLGTSDQRFRAAYIGTGGLSVDGNVTVTGNLTAGNISYTGNVFVGDLQGSVYADDSTIMVDAVDNAMFADSATFGEIITTQITNQFPVNITTNGGGPWQFAGNILRGPEGGSWTSAADTIFLNSPANGYITLQSTLAGNTVSELFMEHSFIRFLVDNGGPPVTWQMNLDGSFDMPNYSFPAADGSAGQVLKTYGNGTVYWDTAGSDYGNANVADYLVSDFGTFGSNTVVTAGNVVASVVDTGAIVNEFPLGIQTGDGYVWQFAGNILRSPEGGTWTSAANTEYISSNDDGFVILNAYSSGNIATELFMEHGFVRVRVDNGGPAQDWNFRVNGVLDVPGDIIPQANGTQSLGNATNYWSNLWVANNTIFIGGVPLGISAGNVLTVNGEAVLSNDSDSSITTTGNITANTFIGGNIQVDYVIGNTADNLGYIQWQGNSSGDGEGYTTLRLVPDDTLVSNDQYLIIDPTDPSHIHIRAGGTQDSSQAELFLGGEVNYVRVTDGTGVRLQNQTRNDTFYNYSDHVDFNTGTWYESAGTYFVQYTTADAELVNVSFQFNDDNENTLRVYYNAGADNALLTSAGSVSNLGGGVYRVSVNEAPPANPTAITELEYEIWTTRTNSARLENNDFAVSVTDDVSITGADGFRLINNSGTEPIQIITNDNDQSRIWDFGSDGTLETPGDIVVAGDITGTSGSSTLVLAAQPDSNTAIQLNNTVDSNIDTVANLEIRTDVSDTARTWTFDTTGNLQLPTNGDIIFRVTNGEVGRIIPGVSDGDGLTVQADTDLELKVIDGVGGEAIWSFETDGNLVFPDDTIQTTAYPGPPQDLTNGNTAVRIPVADGSVVFDVDGFVDIMDVNPDGLQVWGANANVEGNLLVGGYASITGNLTSANLIVTESLFGSSASPQPTISGFSSVSVSGNITGGNLVASATIYGNVDVVLGNVANTAAAKTRITSFGASSYIQTGNGTAGTTGNIVFSPYLDSTEKVVIDTASGNVTAQNFVGNISITGNVTGTSANVDLVAGEYEWSFDNTGNLTLPGNTFAVNYANGSPVDPVTKFASAWTVPTGNSTQSFTVTGSNTYEMWVEGNIPNGIVVWNATVTVTNDNVPVVGQQFAWNYEGGGSPLLITSIPDQIVGTAGAISNAAPSVANTSTFTFGFDNSSGSEQTVRYGWIRIS